MDVVRIEELDLVHEQVVELALRHDASLRLHRANDKALAVHIVCTLEDLGVQIIVFVLAENIEGLRPDEHVLSVVQVLFEINLHVLEDQLSE